ncbi:hypothetical protein CYK37_30090 [Mesorhizobium loti]|nr:hypothetical protein [Mesorhizobium loti]PLP55543.1 hypothetical protein CYK37_30090 [Mesorhizobium loti]
MPGGPPLTPRIYGYLAGLVVILTIIGVVYGKGRLDAAHKAELRATQIELSAAVKVIEGERKARQQDAIRATEAAKRQASLNTKIDELNAYVDTLEDADRECLSGPDVERLRDLWK